MKIYSKSWILIVFSIRLFETAFSSLTNTTEEKQVEWIFYSDDFTQLDYSRQYSTFGVSYKKTLEFTNDLSSYNYDEKSQDTKHVELLRYCKNSSSFYKSLKEISNFDSILDSSKHWKPKFFLVWPGILKTSKEAETLFRNEIMDMYSQNLSIENNIYVVIRFQKPNATFQNITLWESYSINTNMSISHELPPMNWYNMINKMDRRGNLYGAIIRVMTTDDPNYELVAKFKKTVGQPEFESGTAVNLLWYIRDRINFTIAAVKGNWTLENAEGDIVGGAIEMEEDIADLCISQTPMTPRREQHIHFLQPTFLNGLHAFFIQPSASHFRDIYYKSFEPNVWISLLCIWIIMLITMHSFAWIKNQYSEIEVLDKEILDESIFWALGAVCQQGWHKQPTSFSIRLIFLTGYLTGLVCFVAFSASIVSTLSVKSNPINTFDDLVKAKFQMYVQEYSTAIVYLDSFLKTQKDFTYVVNESVALSYLLETKLSLITYPDDFHMLISSRYNSRFICNTFSSLPVRQRTINSAMMVQKGSQFTELFNYQIILMIERGINHRFFKIFIRGTHPICLDLSSGYTQSLEMIDVQSAFIILVIGHLLSMVFLGVEKIWKCFQIKTTW